MSYFTRQHRVRSLLVAGTTAVAVSITACSASNGSSSVPSAASDNAESSAGTLLAPADFESFIADNSDVPVINVHIPYEGHLDGTDEFIAFDSILDSADLPTDKDEPIALYCRSGNMSAQATDDLVAAGYADVVDLEGGMNAWTRVGGELVQDPGVVDA